MTEPCRVFVVTLTANEDVTRLMFLHHLNALALLNTNVRDLDKGIPGELRAFSVSLTMGQLTLDPDPVDPYFVSVKLDGKGIGAVEFTPLKGWHCGASNFFFNTPLDAALVGEFPPG